MDRPPDDGNPRPAGDAPQPSGDEFRRRLKDLGYLENPLERFFIGGSRRGGVVLANLKIALKVGILGGVFLGVVTAIGFALLAPGTFASLAAAAKLALYFSVVFTVLFTALELVIGIVATVLGRTFRHLFTRTQMIALYSGVFAGLVVVVYGTLWWWALAGEGRLFSSRSLIAFVVIAGLAAGISLLTRLAVSALLAVLGGADLAARGKGRATKLYFAVLVAAVAVFVGLRLLTAREVPVAPSAFEKTDSHLSVTLIAVDGADFDFFKLCASSGECPNLAALVKKGCSAPLEGVGLRVNPALWTSVATGVAPAKHGVTAFGGQEIPGLGLYVNDRVGFGLYDALLSALPAVGLSRRAALRRSSAAYPAVWDIIAKKGDISGVVNWWGTWPADDFHGFLVTDRMYAKLQVAKATGKPPVFEREIFPPTLFDRLADYPLTDAKVTDDAFDVAEDIDRFAVTAALTGSFDYDRIALAAVYLPGLDIYENSLYSCVAAAAPLARSVAVFQGVGEYWRYLDGLLEPLVERADPAHVVVFVADPGMPKPYKWYQSGAAERGFVIVAGGPARRIDSPVAVRAVDIAPAVLYLLGFPVSKEMDGRVPAEVLDASFVAAHPPVTVDTFGRVSAKSEAKYSVDSELVDRLRSLGYLQ